MKTPLYLIIFLLCAFNLSAQQYRYIYYLDANLLSTDQNTAVILGKGLNESGLFRLDCYSIDGGTLFIKMYFKDSTLIMPEGRYISYHLNGRTDRSGDFNKGVENGLWQSWDTAGRKIDSIFYQDGIVIKRSEFKYYSFPTPERVITHLDSLNNTYHELHYSNDSLIEEASFTGNNGTLKIYTKEGIKSESLSSRISAHAEFPGQVNGWKKFLEQNMDPMVLEKKNAPNGSYSAVLKFAINTDGRIGDIEVLSDEGYGTGAEAIRVLKKSPKWKPGMKYGNLIKSYRTQKFTLFIQY